MSPDFKGVLVDQILKRLEDPDEPGFEDHRHCLVFWARPPQKLKDLIAEVQRRLKTVAPSKCIFMFLRRVMLSQWAKLGNT